MRFIFFAKNSMAVPYFSFLLSLILCLTPTLSIAAQYPATTGETGEDSGMLEDDAESEQTDLVNSFAELTAWLSSHPEGGSVQAASDLVCDKSQLITIRNPVSIDMNGFTLWIPDDLVLIFTGDFTFFTEGSSQPIFDVGMNGVLGLNYTSVIARGPGARAVLLRNPDGLRTGNSSISAIGADSVALEAPDGISTSILWLSASGPGSAALRTCGPVSLFYSDLSADGSAIWTADDAVPVFLDTCRVSPAVDQAAVTTTAFTVTYPHTSTMFVPIPFDPDIDGDLCRIVLNHELKYGSDMIEVEPIWNSVSIPDRPGFHTLTIPYTHWLPQVPLTGGRPLEAPAWLYPRDSPVLTHANPLPTQARITLKGRNISPKEKYRLWCSAGEGDTWQEWKEWTEPVDYAGNQLAVEKKFILSEKIRFQLERADGVNSNILEISFSNGRAESKPIEGDRDLSDRDPQPPVSSRPDHGKGDGGGSSASEPAPVPLPDSGSGSETELEPSPDAPGFSDPDSLSGPPFGDSQLGDPRLIVPFSEDGTDSDSGAPGFEGKPVPARRDPGTLPPLISPSDASGPAHHAPRIPEQTLPSGPMASLPSGENTGSQSPSSDSGTGSSAGESNAPLGKLVFIPAAMAAAVFLLLTLLSRLHGKK